MPPPCGLTRETKPTERTYLCAMSETLGGQKRRRRMQTIARGGRTPGLNSSNQCKPRRGGRIHTATIRSLLRSLKMWELTYSRGCHPGLLFARRIRGLTRLSRPSGCGGKPCGRSGDRPYRDCAYPSTQGLTPCGRKKMRPYSAVRLLLSSQFSVLISLFSFLRHGSFI
jgi:hypothetical protein